MNQQTLSAFIWAVADLLRGDYKQSDYGKVILPFTVLRRLDCVLEATKPAVLAEYAAKQKAGVNPEPFLLRKSKQGFYNASPLDMKKLMGDQDHIRENLFSYIQAFAPAVRDLFERFDFHTQVDRLHKCGLLYQVAEKFSQIDLHPEAVDNHQMGLVFEELIRKFAEISNETAGEHFTPREVIRLMVAEQEKLIALLKEKRQAVISHAVTKGLDPVVPMKDSGIEWLGEVPAHWSMKRLKHISPFITVGIVVNPSTFVAEDTLRLGQGLHEHLWHRSLGLECCSPVRELILRETDKV